MSTIVYDGESIASDSRVIGDFIHPGGAPKIFHFPETGNYFGIAGCVIPAMHCVEWLNDGAKPSKRPELPEGQEFNILWVTSESALIGDQDCLFMPIQAPFAIGSGGHLALGAITAGASIDESIHIASMYDQYTDDVVVLFTIEEKKSNRRMPAKKKTTKKTSRASK